MASTNKGVTKKPVKATLPLSSQAHQQSLDYLDFAAKHSDNPAIRDLALQLAKETKEAEIEQERKESEFQRKQVARVSPALILSLIIALFLGVVLGCWYAFLHYKQSLAFEVSAVTMLLFVVVVSAVLLVSGHLSQTDFMQVVKMLVEYIKGGFKGKDMPTDNGKADEGQGE